MASAVDNDLETVMCHIWLESSGHVPFEVAFVGQVLDYAGDGHHICGRAPEEVDGDSPSGCVLERLLNLNDGMVMLRFLVLTVQVIWKGSPAGTASFTSGWMVGLPEGVGPTGACLHPGPAADAIPVKTAESPMTVGTCMARGFLKDGLDTVERTQARESVLEIGVNGGGY